MWLWNKELNCFIVELHGSRKRDDKELKAKLLKFKNEKFVEKFMTRFVEQCNFIHSMAFCQWRAA